MEKIAVPRGVIIADDSSIIRDNIRMAFGAPWRIFVAANGVEAVEYARRIKAELVILDVRMPRLDGMEACRLIRQLPDYANVPIVLLTAFFIQELEAAAARCGASCVFSKPISVATVQSSIVPLVALARGAAVRQPTGKLAPRPLESLSPVKELATSREVLEICRSVETSVPKKPIQTFNEVMAARRLHPPGWRPA